MAVRYEHVYDHVHILYKNFNTCDMLQGEEGLRRGSGFVNRAQKLSAGAGEVRVVYL